MTFLKLGVLNSKTRQSKPLLFNRRAINACAYERKSRNKLISKKRRYNKMAEKLKREKTSP